MTVFLANLLGISATGFICTQGLSEQGFLKVRISKQVHQGLWQNRDHSINGDCPYLLMLEKSTRDFKGKQARYSIFHVCREKVFDLFILRHRISEMVNSK